ncbi:hypothetical protein [Capnocytophaga catalasegens]|uniref:Uncharacterized protein n=1 Tax=Capnocytophaga catalasegens TaxID=1004260 RepID=A0AAV5ATP0_9FLAO|nr:hypothetical protein [Capnocytophaga catalasegens]GIZ14541.1 hypothetical protein RCZ03_05420 [Capnocytophaga catalasegens]GJM50743.1 hypothetical protein RCZ15_17160 [Capnocytophaga catalasegens]GJM51896.1 hypothetical protein RCZ16_02140 [Capnocytophaga catalasegens]
MKENEVPQEQGELGEIKEICYATDKDNNYVTVQSSGWEAKTIALKASIDFVNERIAQAKSEVQAGSKSPIVYYMECARMDWAILADYMGMWKWRVKRHSSISVFKHLPEKILQKYAKIFNISVEELKNPQWEEN